MKKIAILYICTGKYKAFWKGFYESSEKLLLTDCEKEYFVFTDKSEELFSEGEKIHFFEQESQEWPYSSLLRFSFFLRIEQKLKSFDYICFFNANAEIVQAVTEEMFLPCEQEGEDLVVVQHPYYMDFPVYQYPYSRNLKSGAFIPYSKGKYYVQGCLIGGTSKAFLEMCHELDYKIKKDLKRNVIPVVHDESYLNRYIVNHTSYKLLSPEYAHLPKHQWSRDGLNPIVLLRDKSEFFDVDSFKRDNKVTKNGFWSRLYIKVAYYLCDRKAAKNKTSI